MRIFKRSFRLLLPYLVIPSECFCLFLSRSTTLKYMLTSFLMLTVVLKDVPVTKGKPVDKALKKLEHFWRLSWGGFEDFPSGFPHLNGDHVNVHKWKEPLDAVPFGLPIEGILERRDHPYHSYVACCVSSNSPISTHLTSYNPKPSGHLHTFKHNRQYNEQESQKFATSYNTLMDTSSHHPSQFPSHPHFQRSSSPSDSRQFPSFQPLHNHLLHAPPFHPFYPNQMHEAPTHHHQNSVLNVHPNLDPNLHMDQSHSQLFVQPFRHTSSLSHLMQHYHVPLFDPEPDSESPMFDPPLESSDVYDDQILSPFIQRRGDHETSETSHD